jgi:nicotinamide-nucleotide amidase
VSAPTAAVLLTGNELLRGVIADRNAAHLAARLEELGLSMRRTLMVGDGAGEIEEGLRELLERADLVVTSGGLGPTHDDRTVEAVAAVAGVPLVLDEALLARITTWTDGYASRTGFEPHRFLAGNRKQAHIPVGASVLGLAGTAPGLVVAMGERRVLVLPGVPSELRRLFELAPDHPDLRDLFGRAVERSRWVTRTYGISESGVADLFAQAGGDPPGVETSICARNFEIEVDVRALPDAVAAAERMVTELRASLGAHVFATSEEPLAAIVLELLRTRGLTVATAESCTGGLVAAALTAIPGSSDAFVGSAVTYSDDVKRWLAGVPRELLDRYGAVSAEVAEAMATGARSALRTDLAVAVTGIAGPGGGTAEKPVGLVYLHLSAPWGGSGQQMLWPGQRDDIRRRATVAALHMIRAEVLAHA